MARTETTSSRLGRQWRALLPQAAFVSPHAPEPCLGAPMGRQWFALSNRPPDDPAGAEDRWNGVVKARGAVDAFLDAELAAPRPRRFEAGAGRLQPGHDDGAACRLAAPPRAGGDRRLFGHAGRRPEQLNEATARDARGAPPPILLVHGDQDPLIPLEAMFMAAEALAGRRFPTQWHLSLGIGHGIDKGGLRHGGLFLAQALTGRSR